MKLKNLKILLSVVVAGMGIQEVSSASKGAVAAKPADPKPTIVCTTLSSDNRHNAHACGCPKKHEVNEILSRIGSTRISYSDIKAVVPDLPSSSCTTFLDVSDNLELAHLGGKSYNWCLNDAADASSTKGGCSFGGGSDCYTIGSSSPIMIYKRIEKKISCLDNAPSETAILSDIGEFQGTSGSAPNYHCNYTNGVVKYHH